MYIPNPINRKERLINSEFYKYRKNLSYLVNGKRWKDITKKDKLIILFEYIINKKYLSISLLISDKIIDKIKNLSQKQQTDFIRRQLNKNLKNNLGYIPKTVWLVANEQDRALHIHGIIETRDNEKQIKEVLKKSMFGKNYKHLDINKYILKANPIFAPKSWLRYMTKDKCNTRKKVFNNVYICNELIKEIKRVFGSI